MVAVWLGIGGLIVLVGAAEAGVRLARAVGAEAGAAPVADPSVLSDQARRRIVPDAHRGEWSLPLQSRLVNIDSAGRRVTPQPPVDSDGRKVLMLGGSEMWGVNASDSATIPGRLAAVLREAGAAIEVVNLGQPDFVFMQAMMTLLVELSLREPPSVAVILTGDVEIEAAIRSGQPGSTLRQPEYQRWLELGKRSFREELLGLPRHSLALRAASERRAGQDSSVGGRELCDAVAAHYRNLADALEALARARGFALLLYLAPSAAPSGSDRAGPAAPPSVVAQCRVAIAEAMADWTGSFAVLDPAPETPEGGGSLGPSGYRAAAALMAPLVQNALQATGPERGN
ncbi:MAG: hypothetical protein AB7R55_10970 [Gemmatimonadales bacterium]